MTAVTLSKQTLAILKNYATINTSIVVKAGNVLKTISNAENILATAKVEETFPIDFAIYDLTQFIAGLALFEDPVLHFDNPNYVTIRDQGQGRRVKYYFSDPEITMKAAPDRDIKFPGGNVEFFASYDNIYALTKAALVYGLPDFTVDSKQDSVTLKVRDKEDETSNSYSQKVRGSADGEYSLDFKVENLRLYEGDYNVDVSNKLISHWKHDEIDLSYYIALEP
tara:strand:+ start:842 stop:1513 length:672 start_codon:yes stop_codon:yes gene_type:complete